MTEIERPIPASYWVESGRFLAGEYPGRPQEHALRQRMIAFLRAGFDTFIDLTEPGEREPYAHVLLEEAPHYGLQATHQRFSIGDLGTPQKEHMRAILKSIQSALAAGRKVYVHCWAGVGRTGTTVGCYLVQNGMSGAQALTHLAKIYTTAAQSLYYARSPETKAQEKFILNWTPEG
ncbi:MAG: protein-tyrosine phosphatase family protein [Anaerolineales bacterium]